MRVAPLLLVASTLLAGCFHAGEEDVPPTPLATDENGSGTLDIPTPEIVRGETNRTVNGTGGKPHVHDYWLGRNRVQIFQQDLSVSLIPVLPEKQPGSVWAAETGLPPGVLVYEGTGKVEIVVDNLAPGLTGLKVRVKTAMDFEFRPPVALSPGTPLVLDIRPEEADMPHATNSLWEFRFLADGANPAMTLAPDASLNFRSFNFTLTVVKARDVSNWPGHPDFYGGKAARLVLDKTGRTTQVGVQDAWLYGDDANNIQAERLISMGTDHLYVFVNVTRAQSPIGSPEGYFLEYRNATGQWRRVRDEANYTTTSQSYRVPVTPDGLDSPYAPQSRWQFRILAVFKVLPEVPGVVGRIGLCPGCFAYELDYHLTAIAYPADDPEAGSRG